jgi:hypothetical protein
MLDIKRKRSGRGLTIEAICDLCGDPLMNAFLGVIVYRKKGELREQLMHKDCGHQYCMKHRSYGFVPAGRLFDQLGGN